MFKVDRYEEEDSDHLEESKPIPISQIMREKKTKSKPPTTKPFVEVEEPKAKKIKTVSPLEKIDKEQIITETLSLTVDKEQSDIEDPDKEEYDSEEEGSISDSPSQKNEPSELIDIDDKIDNTGYLPVFQLFNEEAESETLKKQFKKSKMGLPEWLANPTTVSSQESLPLSDLSLNGILAPHLIKRCEKLNITELFAVQKAVIPLLARSKFSSLRFSPGDLCVSAPTGSGKTLAYVLPIVNRLLDRVVLRLRALIIVPTRDLMLQVKETFAFFCSGTNLRVGAFTKNSSLLQERQRLVENLKDPLMGGSSLVDILVTTPGRLMDHLKDTPNFSLQHLEFMVIDEADRLLSDNFSDWLPKVLAVLEQKPEFPLPRTVETNTIYRPLSLGGHGPTSVPGLSHDAVNRDITPSDPLHLFSHTAPQIQKLLFSATLTRNPGKIAALKLQQPKYIAIQGSEEGSSRYTTPSSLEESYLVGPSIYKPLLLLYLLTKYQVKSAIVFTRSVEASVRLNHFVSVYCGKVAQESGQHSAEALLALETAEICPGESLTNLKMANFSSDLSRPERQTILKKFKCGEINLLVCSDLIARGLDVEGVDAVINYDTPRFIKQYIHRVGRTARAGKAGRAITLLSPNEVAFFKKMHDKAERKKLLKQESIQKTKLDSWMPHYEVSALLVDYLYF
ncbi:ATP-dependent RNA helicase dbp6, variant 2 [Entomophthora muscae]|uniref:ATP-dependent RNA helicase dbp6, variant 2 n=1 Tax=Entomophthora muscae TaxID=34485 RepID=A0ACC2S8T7_9FUNG|nr:ATP-dependent RNA helicase dbp6, variant 2 [Entomophthora muscae]